MDLLYNNIIRKFDLEEFMKSCAGFDVIEFVFTIVMTVVPLLVLVRKNLFK